MNFQSFCDDAKEIDSQIVDVTNAIVINFFNRTGKKFSTDHKDIVMFLNYMLDNHVRCVEIIENHSEFDPNSTYLNYKESPYRALYKSLSEEAGLGGIATLGGSQTFALTGVIAKFVCFLSGNDYLKIKDNTYLDKDSIANALSNLPENFTDLVGHISETEQPLDMRGLFERWMLSQGLSERSINRYAGTCISEADKVLSAERGVNNELYKVKSLDEASKAKDVLDGLIQWQERNQSGNGMYDAGIKKYLEFLGEYSFPVRIPKPFVLLAGISGTGKTRFVRKQAAEHGIGSKNFCLVPVRPDWHEPSDLLGYVSRIGQSPEYVSTKVLQFIIDAWGAIAPNANKSGTGELNFLSAPYWLCLDEMNLAPVEQYFADYLSVLESRNFLGGKYECDPLLDKSVLHTKGAAMQSDLKLDDNQGLWEFFLEHGIPLPPNLIVAGTVNMDETTHGFSRKVIDRALTIDFGEFFPNDYSKIFGGQDKPKIFTYGLNTQVSLQDINCDVDIDGQKTIGFLTSVNDVLRDTPFELAYRALNELLLHVSYFSPETDAELQAVWDDFLMTKVLPRIDGDEDKLRVQDANSSSNVLDMLEELLANELNEVWGDGKVRIDLLRVQEYGNQITDVVCRSRKKISWMKGRLEANTFTNYWP